ncbi:hypothetical protein GOY13_01820 [Wolbachia endosymbiont of Cruorifilaria tuberocauda]|uniref:hypothetical protein n=1 Tax=Wolbachia endosymbiont of Cruorifilaria tuberocauda TaxID=1812111 RepID=UPI00158A637C|nr:hypothetical protein [Wolbachia endosymbiont of Cruorifilaria tuberocauda]QKX01673.1 hypothetical protein GOY13_01820 [Wolbachia endosymbiont of Cruorifilaria tuberocauda]
MSTINCILLILSISVAIKSLFSNDKKDTLYNPNSLDKMKWSDKISDGISKILGTEIEKDKLPVKTRENSKLFTMFDKVKANQNKSFQWKEDDRRKVVGNQHGL